MALFKACISLFLVVFAILGSVSAASESESNRDDTRRLSMSGAVAPSSILADAVMASANTISSLSSIGRRETSMVIAQKRAQVMNQFYLSVAITLPLLAEEFPDRRRRLVERLRQGDRSLHYPRRCRRLRKLQMSCWFLNMAIEVIVFADFLLLSFCCFEPYVAQIGLCFRMESLPSEFISNFDVDEYSHQIAEMMNRVYFLTLG